MDRHFLRVTPTQQKVTQMGLVIVKQFEFHIPFLIMVVAVIGLGAAREFLLNHGRESYEDKRFNYLSLNFYLASKIPKLAEEGSSKSTS